ncbi:MAG: helix-turn-helix transcriptional regulator [Chloroflexota bacterium]
MSPGVPAQPSTDGPIARVNQISVEVGAVVRDARRRRGWGMRDLARRAAISTGMVQRVEAGERASLTVYARLAQALGIGLNVQMTDAQRPTTRRQDSDLVHAAMGEIEVSELAARGYAMALDEPWQHYHFAGRADVVAWDLERQALLHIENKGQLPDVQDGIGRFKATQAYLGGVMWERRGLSGRPRSETHVLAVLWSAEVLRVMRRQPSTFRATWPDPMTAFEGWLRGEPPAPGAHATLVLLDPFASGRQRRMVGIDEALGDVRPRVAGYAEAAARLRRAHPG